MKIKSAHEAIRAILQALPDSELPQPTKTEASGDGQCVWFGGTGYNLGTAKKKENGGEWKRRPKNYQDGAIREALEREAVFRLDAKHLEGEEA